MRSGRAGFVMANSAARCPAVRSWRSERKLIQDRAVDVMVAIGSNFFYTVTLPCTLWFFDKGKAGTDRKHKVLFIDARHIFRQIDRAHRNYTEEQIEFLANIVRLYRGEEAETGAGSAALLKEKFPDGRYVDVLRAHGPACLTSFPVSASGTGWVGPCSPWSASFPPLPPLALPRFCSAASQVL